MRLYLFSYRPEPGRFALISTVYRFEPVLRKPPERSFRCEGLPAVFGGLYVEPGDRILSLPAALA
jgi:hypothetical protein